MNNAQSWKHRVLPFLLAAFLSFGAVNALDGLASEPQEIGPKSTPSVSCGAVTPTPHSARAGIRLMVS